MALNIKKAEEKKSKADELIDDMDFSPSPKTSTEAIIADLNHNKPESTLVESNHEDKPKFVMPKGIKTNKRKGQNRSIYFDDAQYNLIKKYADKEGISFSSMLYEILKQVL